MNMKSAAKCCFVIGPIGAGGSEIREHADNVMDFIIEPAMKQPGIHAYRSDHNLTAGKISRGPFDWLRGKNDLVGNLWGH